MTEFCLAFIVCLVAVVFELNAGSLGFFVPAAAVAVMYVAVAYGAVPGVAAASACGLGLDLVYANGIPSEPFLLCFCVVIGRVWVKYGETKNVLLQAFPGLFVGMFGALPYTAHAVLAAPLEVGAMSVILIKYGLGIFSAGFSLPLLAAAMDAAAESLGIQTYASAKNQPE